ncbi:MAG: recombination regulator RecX [Rubrivivax sp.]|nr:recombination regulator RecX [Rubrivivax sp.]
MQAPLSLKARALRQLARREHSRAELERKLAAHLARSAEPPDAGAARREIGQVLDELAARGLLSDERAAESLIASHAQRFGSRRLQHVLRTKGLAPELVAATLEPVRAGELERARELWRRRFGGVPAADAAARAKQARFLAGRGFDADVVGRVVKGLGEVEGTGDGGES